MGESLERVVMHRRDHSLDNPIPENSIRFGVPNSCNENCHADKTPEWSIQVLNQWYGDENRKKITYASNAMYEAKAGNPEVVPELIKAMSDENLRIILRASAISFLGKNLVEHAKPAIPALLEQLRSAHPLMRLTAAEALGRIGDRRAIGPVSQLLNDQERTVRITAISAMINMGVVHGQGEMGQRFEEVKAEYLASLQSWPNVPQFRINVGLLHFIDSKFDDAIREFQYALKINPEQADALHYLGLTYARMDQWDDALDAWEKLKDMNPDFQDVDQLISAAKEKSRDR
jgi:tetratricopeptide (TPR) repeat protein